MSVQDQQQEQLWGGETTKAVANFPISGETVPVPVLRWLGRIKGAAARVNAELGLLDADRAKLIAAAGSADPAGGHRHRDRPEHPQGVRRSRTGTPDREHRTGDPGAGGCV